MSDTALSRPPVVFLWGQFGPYHHDRCQAAAASLPDHAVIGVEVASGSDHHYQWQSSDAVGFSMTTLFPGESYEKTGLVRRMRRLVTKTVGLGARHNFLCHYDQIEIFILAVALRLRGRRVFMMWESKFDDRPRTAWRELLKWILLRPYNGAITSGPRAHGYLDFLGMKSRPVADGYDTISVARLRALAGVAVPPADVAFTDRCFIVVARLVPKKNLSLVIAAYDLYRRRTPANARPLVFLGAGPLEAALKAEIAKRGLSGVEFPGFLQADGVARHMARGLCLILPSIEEQWGLVVNEALALGVPVCCSENVGARDTLIRHGLNGYVFKPHEADRLADYMQRLSEDEVLWRSMATSAAATADAGDVAHFGAGVRSLTGLVR